MSQTDSSDRAAFLLRTVKKSNSEITKSINQQFTELQTSIAALSSNVSNIATVVATDSNYHKDLQFFYGKLDEDFDLWYDFF